jgi:hypothetical protein
MPKNNIRNSIYMPRSTDKPVVNNSLVHNRPLNQNPSLFSSVKQGFGFGMGSSIAHNIFDSKPAQPRGPVIDKITEFKECMEKTYNRYEECKPILK